MKEYKLNIVITTEDETEYDPVMQRFMELLDDKEQDDGVMAVSYIYDCPDD